MTILTKYSALATTTLLTVSLGTPAHAATRPQEPAPQTAVDTSQTEVVKAPDAAISFERVAVGSTKAPEVPPLADTTPATTPTNVNPPTPTPDRAQAQPAATQTPKPVTNNQPTITPAASIKKVQAPASGKGAAILAAAMAQIGRAQDCTALVSNSLASVGIMFHGWPWQYAQLGTLVSTPEPGDILIYADAGAGVAHVAIYAGNGMAVHGGFNGSTALFSANVGSGYAAYRVA